MAKTSKTKAYDANSLQALKFPDNVRHRPGMYCGAVNENGVFRIWKEIIDNSVDEHQEGHGKKIVVVYDSKKKLYILADEGRGVPSGINKKEGKSGFELVFATLHGSGKFDQSNYATSSGLNGVGASICQALASSFTAYSHNEGTWKSQAFSRGRAKSKVEKLPPPAEFAKTKRGTVVTWVPDTEIFGDCVIDINKMRDTCKHLTMLNPGLEIVLRIDGKETKYVSENGLLDMIYGTEEQKQIALVKPFQLQTKGIIDIAVVWQDDELQQTWSYVNSSHTPEEGTHVQGARNALLEALRAEVDAKSKTDKKSTGRKGKNTKDDGSLDAKYLLMGIRTALNWRMSNPVYSGQTKDKLTNSEAVTVVKNIVLPEFSSFLKKNPKLISTLIDRAKKFQKASEKFQQDLKAVKSLKLGNPNARGLLPGKLLQATGYKPEERELFLVEGGSAAGTAKKARMPWQEILELRGKVLNAAREDTSKILNNQEYQDIIVSVGTEIGENCKTSGGKVRIGRITILTDADQDGKHICALLLAFFVKYMRPWVLEGRIQFVNLPLFLGKHGETRCLGFTREEMLAKFPEAKRRHVLVTRMKGLAEASGDELMEIGMNPETRRVHVLSLNDADILEVDKVMGENVSYRKEFLGIKERV